MKKQSSSWEKALKLKIKPDEIMDIVQEVAERHDKSEPSEPSEPFGFPIGVLLSRYAHKRNGADWVYCVHKRMMCLGDLMKSGDPRVKGYTKDTNDPACTVTHAAMFYATALCPLRIAEERVWFDPDEFFEIALKDAESEGNA